MRLVFINHLHNPTGSTLDAAQLTALARLADAAGAILVSDEVFRPIALGGQATPSVTALSGRAAALGDLSKPWGLDGLRVGWVACRDARLLARLGEVRDYTTMCTNGPAEHLAAIALRHSEALLTPRLANARANRADLAALVDRAEGLPRWQRPGGGYSAWLRLPDGVEAAPFCRRLAERRSCCCCQATSSARTTQATCASASAAIARGSWRAWQRWSRSLPPCMPPRAKRISSQVLLQRA